MTFRSMICSAALVAMMTGCGGSSKPDAGCFGITCPTGGGTAGTGGGAEGGGSGGGSGGGTVDAGPPPAATILEAKATRFPAKVDLHGVVVTAVSFAAVSGASNNCAGLSTKGVNASFWVADPNADHVGVWAEKFRCDGDADYFPHVGDIVNLSGIMGFESNFQQQDGYRIMIKSEFDYIPSSMRGSGYVCALSSTPPCTPFVVEKTGTMAPLPANEVPETFGADGGIKAEPTYSGSRIKIAGPLTVKNINPEAFHQVSADPNDTRYFGFELSNGVLVNAFRTYSGATLEDGGASTCDVRAIIQDGGTFEFPNGVAGVWDTYTHASCADGGTKLYNCFNNKGTIPGTPDANYTNVLYPTSCEDFLQ